DVAENVRRAWDFHAVHGTGSHYWVVGRPGSVALHSDDRGQKWEVVRTGQQLPLNGIFFTDEQHGWAVGELGIITATSDGGKTWQIQHRGGQRAAVLFLHARPQGIPLATVAQLGGQDDYLCAALRVTASDSTTASLDRSTEAARFSAAVRQAGGAAGEMLWEFPVSSHLLRVPRLELLRAWNVMQEDQAADQLLRQLVLTIRMWQPAVIITDNSAEKSNGFGCDALLAEAVRAAFEKAGDGRIFSEQLTGLRLGPWQADKVYSVSDVSPQRKQGQVRLDLTAIAARLQTTPREFASAPAALLAGGAVTLPDQRDFQLLAAHIKDAAGHRQLMQGTNLPYGGLARRARRDNGEMPEDLVKAIHKQTTLRTLSETPAGTLNDPNRLLSQVGPMLAEMPDDIGARTAFGVANRYVRMGQWSMAREVFLLLVDRYPAHPLAMESYRWLIRHNSSSEARHRYEMGHFFLFAVEHEQHGVPIKEGSTLGKPGEPDANIPGIKMPAWKAGTMQTPDGKTSLPPVGNLMTAKHDQQKGLFDHKDQIRQWYQSSLALEPRLAGFGPLVSSDPSLQLCLQAARRSLGDFQTAQKWYTHFVSRQPEGPWRSAALAELWLANRTGSPPKPVMTCPFTDSRPLLDGKLDEACWQSKTSKLQNAAGNPGKEFAAEVRFAYDYEFLYLAVKCTHPADRYAPPVKPRTRDADLRGHDRVSILLDLDRDYCTCYHLQVDQRGCVCEDCWGDKSWD
ncbi:MAG TPA: hypothetical protein VMG10_04050, partial [Gemmataceae bacterium]|nr:hypothetical protein [Gemmataceae bacterium]